MTYIEPVRLGINTAGEQLSPSLEEEQITVPNWPDTYNWAFNKVVGDSFEIIDSEAITEVVRSSLNELFQPVDEIDENISEYIRNITTSRYEKRDIERVILYDGNKMVLPASDNGHMFIISEYKDNVTSVIDSFESKIAEFSDVASDFGLDVTLYSGSDFAQEMSAQLDSEIVEREEFDNTLEETIYSEISDRITTAIDANVTLRFGEDDPEVFEYDLLIHGGSDNRIVIEAKDASREEANLGKSKLIDRPRDKTNIIEGGNEHSRHPFYNQDNTEVFVIVKHMDEEDFNKQKQKAERRDIRLMKYEDGDYLDSVEGLFRNLAHREL